MQAEIIHPVPPGLLDQAAALWWAHFAPPLTRRGAFAASHGVVAVAGGAVVGVAGLRDHRGGFARGAAPAAILYRAGPATDDLVIDGIAVARPRQGDGARLLAGARDVARRWHRPGLRAEVAMANHAAMAFYAANGFCTVAQGRYGWPWTGPVAVLRRAG